MAAKTKFEVRKASVISAVEEAKASCEELRDELQDWLDNLPESLQDGEKAEALQEAIDQLEEAINALENIESAEDDVLAVFDTIGEFEYSQPHYAKSVYLSRAKRLEIGTATLHGIPTEAPDSVTDEEQRCQYDEVYSDVQTAIDAIQSVEFPAAR